MSDLQKWAAARLLVTTIISSVLAYSITAFALWDVSWLDRVPTWSVGARLFVALEFPLVTFLIFWGVWGVELLSKGRTHDK